MDSGSREAGTRIDWRRKREEEQLRKLTDAAGPGALALQVVASLIWTWIWLDPYPAPRGRQADVGAATQGLLAVLCSCGLDGSGGSQVLAGRRGLERLGPAFMPQLF